MLGFVLKKFSQDNKGARAANLEYKLIILRWSIFLISPVLSAPRVVGRLTQRCWWDSEWSTIRSSTGEWTLFNLWCYRLLYSSMNPFILNCSEYACVWGVPPSTQLWNQCIYCAYPLILLTLLLQHLLATIAITIRIPTNMRKNRNPSAATTTIVTNLLA